MTADGPTAPLASRLKRAGLAITLLLAIPLVIVTLGALFITHCDYLDGLKHYLLGPGVGCLYAGAIGLFLGGFGKRRWATAGLILWWFAALISNLLHFYNHPPIDAYNPFIGFFNGAVYDDYIPVTKDWWTYRGLTVLQAVLLVVGHILNERARGRWKFWLAWCFVWVAILPISFNRTSADIIEELGGSYETEHFIIHYPLRSPIAQRIEDIASDHEFRYEQLKTTLGVAPQQRIRSFVYRNADEKQRLMGAGRTYIAKPWSREIHLNAIEYGAPVLKHELAHVFGAEISEGWLGIPTVLGVIPKMALVEGFAVALTGPKGRLTAHQWSAAMRSLKIAPPMETILNATGFLSTHAGQAYTLSGSFLRFLLDEHGITRFRELYRTGSLHEAYELPAGDLVQAWTAFLDDRDQVPLTETDLKLAEYHFDVPSKFHRVCALEIARWEREAADARADGAMDRALSLYERVAEHDPENPYKQWQLLNALIAQRDLERATETARRVSTDAHATRVLQANARARLADILWLQNHAPEAADIYETLLQEPLQEASLRRYEVCARAARWDNPLTRNGVRDYLLSTELDQKTAVEQLEALREAAPEEALLPYLLGRRLAMAHPMEGAESMLQTSLQLGLQSARLERAAYQLQGRLYLSRNDPQRGRAAFEASRALHASAGYQEEMSDWIERCNWMYNRLDAEK